MREITFFFIKVAFFLSQDVKYIILPTDIEYASLFIRQ